MPRLPFRQDPNPLPLLLHLPVSVGKGPLDRLITAGGDIFVNIFGIDNTAVLEYDPGLFFEQPGLFFADDLLPSASRSG